jgi:tetratricopeptide (TPR) repeat protein
MITPRSSTLTICVQAGLLILSICCAPAIAQSSASACGPLRGQGQYGPYDYRTDKDKLEVVERYHFSAAVEALIRGSQNTLPGGDLDYTLRAFPNHHRALLAMVRYGEKMKSPHPSGADYPVECYFERAIRFQPDDITVRMIYATYLGKNSRQPEAIQHLEQATTMAKDSAFSHYNIGLIYFDLKEYDKALHQAHRSIALGFPRDELRAKLMSVGKWSEPK